MNHALVEVESVGWSAGGTRILGDVSLQAPEGGTLGIVGPNGSGKSSLLRIIAGLESPDEGEVRIGGRPLSDFGRRELARTMSYVEQLPHTDRSLLVTDVIALGRVPHRASWAGPTKEDLRVIERVAAETALTDLLERPWHALSGGERQRTQIARALAQETPLMLLDEPTNHLDIAHQLGLLKLVRESGNTSVIILHDLNLAAMYCDRLVILHEGGIVSSGPPDEILDEKLIEQVFGVRSSITRHDGVPHIRFLMK